MVKIKSVKKRITNMILRAFALWVVVVFLIQVAAPNPVIESMPENCPMNSGNCVRVATDDTSYRYNYLESPELLASSLEVREVISKWFSEERGGKILSSQYDENTEKYFLHIKDNTDYLFFPDDVFVNTGCLEDSNLTVVILQSQSRLGIGDLGVNFERLSELISYLDQYSWSGNNCYSDN